MHTTKEKAFKLILFIVILNFIQPPLLHAYAGPGVAIGAIIVFITVVLAFLASFFLTSYKVIKNILIKLYKISSNIFGKKNSKKQKKTK